MKPEQAYRTGRLAHLRRTVFAQVFNVPTADEQACVFVEPGVIEQLQSITTIEVYWRLSTSMEQL